MRHVLSASKVRGVSIYCGKTEAPAGHPWPTSVEEVGKRHRSFGGGTLRAGVFGVNDGLVSNTCLVMGVAGAAAEPGIIVLTGVAGLLAGAFSMAAGEFISMLSQREMFEHQIAQEADELKRYPKEEAEELALIYAARGIPHRRSPRRRRPSRRQPGKGARYACSRRAWAEPRRSRLAGRRGALLLHRLRHRCEPAAHSVSDRRPQRRDHRRRALRRRALRRRRNAQPVLRQERLDQRTAHARRSAPSPRRQPTASARCSTSRRRDETILLKFCAICQHPDWRRRLIGPSPLARTLRAISSTERSP